MSNSAGENERFRADTLVSIEELLSEELILENQFWSDDVYTGDVHNDNPSTGEHVRPRTDTLISVEENVYSDDFYSTAESRSAEFIVEQADSSSDSTSSFATAFGADALCSRLGDGESVHWSIDYDHGQYSSDFENFSQEPSSRVGVSQIQQEEITHARLEFIAKKVGIIKLQDMTRMSLKKMDQVQPTDDHQSEPLKYFFKKKVKTVQQKLEQPVSETPKESKRGNQESTGEKGTHSTLVNIRNIECLKIDNLFCKMKKVSKTKFHVSEKCLQCRQANGLLAEESFMRRKLSQLKKREFEERLEKHLQQNTLVLVADIINSGPKPSDPPHEIWDRLLRTAKYKETT